jgi:hypothetical protein
MNISLVICQSVKKYINSHNELLILGVTNSPNGSYKSRFRGPLPQPQRHPHHAFT